MGAENLKQTIRELLSPAGITLNGDRPWDIRVRDERFYHRVLRDGSLGFGESYMEGWSECGQLDEFFTRILPTDPKEKIKKNWRLLVPALSAVIFNAGRKAKA